MAIQIQDTRTLKQFSTTTDANDTQVGVNSDFKTKEDDLSMEIVSLRQVNLVNSCQTLRGKEVDTIRFSVTPVLLGVASRGAERNRARDVARRAEPMKVVPTDVENNDSRTMCPADQFDQTIS